MEVFYLKPTIILVLIYICSDSQAEQSLNLTTQQSGHNAVMSTKSNKLALNVTTITQTTMPSSTNSIITSNNSNVTKTSKTTISQPVFSTVVNGEDFSGSGDDPDDEYITTTKAPKHSTTMYGSTSSSMKTSSTNKTPKTPTYSSTWTEITTAIPSFSTKYTSTAMSSTTTTKIQTGEPTSESFTSSGDEDVDISGEDMFTTSKTTNKPPTISSTTQNQSKITTISKSTTTMSPTLEMSKTTKDAEILSGSGEDDMFTTIFPILENETTRLPVESSGEVTTEILEQSGEVEFTTSSILETTNIVKETVSGDFSGDVETTVDSNIAITTAAALESSGELETATIGAVETISGEEESGDVGFSTVSSSLSFTSTDLPSLETSSGEEDKTSSSVPTIQTTSMANFVDTSSGEETSSGDESTTHSIMSSLLPESTTSFPEIMETESGEGSGVFEETTMYSTRHETTPSEFSTFETTSGELSGDIHITTLQFDQSTFTDTTKLVDNVPTTQSQDTAAGSTSEIFAETTAVTDIPSTVIGESTTEVENISDENLFTTEKPVSTTQEQTSTLQSDTTTEGIYIQPATSTVETITEKTATSSTLDTKISTDLVDIGVSTSEVEMSTKVLETTPGLKELQTTTTAVLVTTEAVVQTTNALEITTVEQSIVQSTLLRHDSTIGVNIGISTSAEAITQKELTTHNLSTETTISSETIPSTEPSYTAETSQPGIDHTMTTTVTDSTSTATRSGSTTTESIFEETSTGSVVTNITHSTASSSTIVKQVEIIQGDIRIIAGLNFSTELLNNSSPLYQTTSNDIGSLLTVVYEESALRNNFAEVNGIKFRQGSVLVTYSVVFKPGSNVTTDHASTAFLGATQNGTVLGKYILDPKYGSFKVIGSTTTAMTTPSTTTKTTIAGTTTAQPSNTTAAIVTSTMSTSVNASVTPSMRPAIIEYKIPSWAIGVILALSILVVFFMLFCVIWCCCSSKRETEFYTVPASNSSYTDSLMGEFTLTNKQDFQFAGAYNSIEKDKEKALSETIGGSTRGSLQEKSISIPRKVRIPLGSMDGGSIGATGIGGEVNMAATGDDGVAVQKTSPSASAASTAVASSRDNLIDEIDFDFKDFFIVQVDDAPKETVPNILDENYPYNKNGQSQPNATPANFHKYWEPVGDNGVRVFNYTDDAETYYDEVLQIWNTKL